MRTARLTRDDEERLTREVGQAEAAMARAIVSSPRALAELVRVGSRVDAGVTRTRDVVRMAEDTPSSARINRARLVDVLARAARVGAPGAQDEERAPLAEEIAALRFQARVLDRAAAAMGEDETSPRVAFARARAAARRAKEEWTTGNAYLVRAIARRYRRPGVDAVDLVQDGSIGLIRAVEKFDPTLGHRFRVYAAWWIRQHVFRALASYGRTIRVPLPMIEASHRVARARRVFEGIHGVEPDDLELAAASGTDTSTVAAVAAILEEPVSFYGRAGEEDTSLLDRIADPSVDLPDEQVERAREHERVRALYEALARHEKAVVRLRFGLDGAHEHTQSEVATALGISRDRARRIEEHALAKLRAWSMRSKLGAHVAA